MEWVLEETPLVYGIPIKNPVILPTTREFEEIQHNINRQVKIIFGIPWWRKILSPLSDFWPEDDILHLDDPNRQKEHILQDTWFGRFIVINPALREFFLTNNSKIFQLLHLSTRECTITTHTRYLSDGRMMAWTSLTDHLMPEVIGCTFKNNDSNDLIVLKED